MTDLSFPNSPNFCNVGWSRTAAGLERQNTPSRMISAFRNGEVRQSAPPAVSTGRKLNSAAIATVRASRPSETETLASEHNDAVLARLLGLTVKILRDRAKHAGLSGYSRQRKAELAARLVPYT